MRTMKNVMLDRLTHKYLQKKALTVESAKELTYAEMIEMNIPKIVRDNVTVMDRDLTVEANIREAQKISQAATLVAADIPTYDPLVEEKVAIEVASEYTDEVTPVEVQVVVEEVVAYSEEELRRVFESIEMTGSYTAMLKKIKPMLEEKQYDAELLVTLAKEYAAKIKK